jgi:hypothetical protein
VQKRPSCSSEMRGVYLVLVDFVEATAQMPWLMYEHGTVSKSFRARLAPCHG